MTRTIRTLHSGWLQSRAEAWRLSVPASVPPTPQVAGGRHTSPSVCAGQPASPQKINEIEGLAARAMESASRFAYGQGLQHLPVVTRNATT